MDADDYLAFPGPGWWVQRPWTLDPDGLLWRCRLGGGEVPFAMALIEGGPTGWEKVVRIDLDVQREDGGLVAKIGREITRDKSVMRWEFETDHADAGLLQRVQPKHRPLRAWTREAVRQVTDQAFDALERMDETWRVGKALREAHLDREGQVQSEPLGALADETFAEVYRIVTEKHAYGYAKVLGRMLSMEPQSVRNRVNQLRKQGLIEPANTRGNT